MPVLPEHAREDLIAQHLAALDQDAERRSLPWKQGRKLMPVVEVSVDHVVLNHKSHRIRAQLESHDDRALVESDPFSEAAQAIIAAILVTTEDYPALRDNLAEEGQREPGVVTRSGMLVNGNTRAVALRELRQRYIRLIVLPEDAGPQEIDRLELQLQMQREFKQDYTFTNQLLAVEDMISRYRQSYEEIAQALGWGSDTRLVAREMRLLSLIRELRRLSDGALRLTDFDDKRQALIDLDGEYQATHQSFPQEAERMKTARLAGLLAGLGYRELREVDGHFVPDYFLPHLREQPVVGAYAEDLVATSTEEKPQPPGVALLVDEPDINTSPEPDGSRLLNILATLPRQQRVELPHPNGSLVYDREDFTGVVRETFELAALDARDDRKKGQSLERPVLLLQDADRQVRRAGEAFAKVAKHPRLDRSKVAYQMRQLRKHLEEFRNRLEAGS
jgi:hypothetical protein